MTTLLCLIRHGETDWNVARRLQGMIDIPLNARGLRQARAAASFLAQEESFNVIYSSDLQRAHMTAEIIGHHLKLPVTQADYLRERNFGILQGLTQDEAAQRYPELHPRIRARQADIVPPEGESLAGFAERVRSGMNDIACQHADETVLVVAHGGVLDIAYRIATRMALAAPRDFPVSNATLNWVAFDASDWRLVAWDQRSHLEGSLDDLPV